MPVTLTIIRYPRRFVFFAFLAMGVHRFPLWLNKKISFYKLLGSGKNGTFDKTPDVRQWAIMAVHEGESEPTPLYGNFINKWWNCFNCEIFTFILEPLEGRGKWDGKQPFGHLPSKAPHDGPIATLTRATIRLNKLKYFWENVAPVANKMTGANGFIMSLGIGEVPWVKQATFSVWKSAEDMKSFAYRMAEHREVIKKTRDQQWYAEEMFVRFKIVAHHGSISGIDPLKGKL